MSQTEISPRKIEKVLFAQKYLEYKNDPIKFMEECIYLPTTGGSTLFKLYEPQKRIVNSFLKDHNLILLKSRQIGMSTICQAIITYLFTFFKNCSVGIVSRNSDEASDFSKKTQDMIDNLPEWIRPKYKYKTIQSFTLTNGCKLYSSAISPSNPGSVFRSKSITLLILDEAAHTAYIDEAWTGIASTVSKAQLDAKKRGIPYGTIILSTPNKTSGIGEWFYKMWCSALANENAFVAHTLHWSEIPDFVNDPEWYERQCKLLNNDKNKIAQELELKFVGTENSLFSEEIQIELQKNVNIVTETTIKIPGITPLIGEQIHCFVKNGETLNKQKFYLMGVDCATAVGRDYSAIEVMDYVTGEQVLEFRARTDPKKLTATIKYINQILCPNSLIIVENTGGYGHSVIYDLYYDEYPFKLFGAPKGVRSDVIVPGLSTNVKTRPLILDALYTHVSELPTSVKSKKLSMELISLVGKSGRIEADKGFNDDLAMAFAFCCYVRKYCRDDIDTDELTQEEVNDLSKSDKILDTLFDLYNGIADRDIIRAAQKAIAYKKDATDDDFKGELDAYYDGNVLEPENTVDINEVLGISYSSDDIDLTY